MVNKEKADKIIQEVSLSKKGKVYMFCSRDGILNCEGVDINNLLENFVNPYTKEIYSLKDISCYDINGKVIFNTFRGLNFSTGMKFVKVKDGKSEKHIFLETKYDKNYMIMCRQSQIFEQALAPTKLLTFSILMYFSIFLTIIGIGWTMTLIGILYGGNL